jgi:hypothetical protein
MGVPDKGCVGMKASNLDRDGITAEDRKQIDAQFTKKELAGFETLSPELEKTIDDALNPYFAAKEKELVQLEKENPARPDKEDD